MTPESILSLLSLAIGFGVAGLVAAAYQLITARPISFRLMGAPARGTALVSVPLLVLAAPFIIMRNTVRRTRGDACGDEPRFAFAALATTIAGFWSLMSGTVVASGWLSLIRLVA